MSTMLASLAPESLNVLLLPSGSFCLWRFAGTVRDPAVNQGRLAL
jgi:hypothetical protein